MANKQRIGFFHAIRDIGVASINKGQFLAFGFFVLVGMIIWKMPGDDVSADVTKLMDGARDYCYLGYVLWVFTGLAYFFHARSLVRQCYREQERIAEERNKAQRKAGVTGGTSK